MVSGWGNGSRSSETLKRNTEEWKELLDSWWRWKGRCFPCPSCCCWARWRPADRCICFFFLELLWFNWMLVWSYFQECSFCQQLFLFLVSSNRSSLLYDVLGLPITTFLRFWAFMPIYMECLTSEHTCVPWTSTFSFFTLSFKPEIHPAQHHSQVNFVFSSLGFYYFIVLAWICGASVESNGEVFEKVRSATACSQETATNLSAPHLSVFLTVNSLAKLVLRDDPSPVWPFVQKRVFWNGSFQKRRLELNWVAPPDRQESDFVGLYRFVFLITQVGSSQSSSPSRDDPRWSGPNSYLIRVKAGRPGGK